MIKDFLHLPPVSLTLVANIELRISPRIFEKNSKRPLWYTQGLRGNLFIKKQKSKISWHCPFKPILSRLLCTQRDMMSLLEKWPLPVAVFCVIYYIQAAGIAKKSQLSNPCEVRQYRPFYIQVSISVVMTVPCLGDHWVVCPTTLGFVTRSWNKIFMLE
jgi:hypothetical protein